MNQSLVRKITYLVIIGMLLIPISMIAQPSTLRSSATSVAQGANDARAGGELSRLRLTYTLAQEKVSEIDPASETMKLASLGLRGLATLILWNQAIDQKKNQNFEGLEATLNLLVKLQPNFVKVWDYQAHNLAYNVSVEFDDYEHRYHWVKKGIKFLTQGIEYNKNDHRITDQLGWITGMKIGYSDEKNEFRRMFRKDRDFHDELSGFIDPETYRLRDYEFDNWKMAYQWYTISREKVIDQGNPKYTGDLIFFMRRPSQTRNMAESLQNEFRSNEGIQSYWKDAYDQWMEFGRQNLVLGQRGTEITLEGFITLDERLERLRSQLDALAPGVRKEIMDKLYEDIGLTEEQRAILAMDVDKRTDVQRLEVRGIEAQLEGAQGTLDQQVAARVPESDRTAANQLIEQIGAVFDDMRTLESNQTVANYRFWKVYTDFEGSQEGLRTQQLMYDASELQRRSIFDDEYQINVETNERVVTQEGAIAVYDRAFQFLSEIMKREPILQNGKLTDDTYDVLVNYKKMLKVTNQKWPRHHILQFLVDLLGSYNQYKLPSSEEVAEMYGEDYDPNQDGGAAAESDNGREPPTDSSSDDSSGS